MGFRVVWRRKSLELHGGAIAVEGSGFRAPLTESNVESGTSKTQSGTSVNFKSVVRREAHP